MSKKQKNDTVMRPPGATAPKEATAPADRDSGRAALRRMLEDLERSRRQIEHARHEWTATFDAITDPIFVHDQNFRIVRANRAYAVRAGLSFEEMIGRPYWEVFPRLDGPLDSCKHDWKKGEEMQVEEIRLADGEVFLSRAFVVPPIDRESRLRIHILEDVTEARRAEAEQRILSAALRQAVESVVVLDRERRITYVNPAFSRVFGYVSNEVVGKSVGSVMAVPGDITAMQPDQVVDRLDAGGTWAGGTVRRARDGTAIPVHISAVAIHSGQREITGYVATFLDLRPIRQAEQRLMDSEARFRTLTENSTDIAAIIEPDGVLRYVSPSIERIAGYRPQELIGVNALTLVHPDDAAYLRGVLEQAVRNPGTVQTAEYRFRHKSGEWRYFEAHGQYVPDIASIAGIVANVRDISQRKQAELALQRANRVLKTLSGSNQALVRIADEPDLLREICRIIVETGGYRCAWVAYVQHDPARSLSLMAQAGSEDPYVNSVPATWGADEHGQGPSGRAIRERTPQVVQDVRGDAGFGPWREAALRRGFASVIALPLLINADVLGVLGIAAAETGVFDTDEISMLKELASDLAYGVAMARTRAAHDQALRERQQAQDMLRTSLIDAVQAIAATLEMRDPYTAGHQRRVAELAVAIAREMGLPEQQMEGIHFGALIHDIGKIQVPGEILSKPGRLTRIEYELIKNHSQAGYDILKGIQFPWPIAQMVLQHHERLDGSGYPQGLRGAEVLLEARILAVADVVEAISSHRPYRPMLGTEAALKEIADHRGSRYDPAVVDACLRLVRENRFTFER